MSLFETDEKSGNRYVVVAQDDPKVLETWDDIGMKMLLHNGIAGVVPIVKQFVDENVLFCYETNTRVSLKEYYQNKSVAVQTADRILTEVIELLQRVEPYFMEKRHFVFLEDYIYLSADGNELWMCYYPTYEMDTYQGLLQLIQFFMKRIRHDDRAQTKAFYELYDIVQERTMSLQEIKQLLQQQRKNTTQTQELSDGKGKTRSRKREMVWEDESAQNAARLRGDERASKYVRMRKGRRKSIAGSCGECISDRPGYMLDRVMEKGGDRIRELGIPDQILLTDGENRIGRDKYQDICLMLPEISRYHASLYCDQERVELQDQMSLNGTYVNGKKIPANSKVSCRVGDHIAFADITFRLTSR